MSSSVQELHPDRERLTRRRILRELALGARVVFHRSWRNEIPAIMLLVLSVLFSVYLVLDFPEIFLQDSNFNFLAFGNYSWLPSMLGAFLVPLVVLGFLIHRLFDDRFIITEDSIVAVNGLLSLKLCSSRVHFAHVRGVEVEQGIFQRLVNTGNLMVGSAAHLGQEVVMKGVGNPTYYREIIAAQVREYVGAVSNAST